MMKIDLTYEEMKDSIKEISNLEIKGIQLTIYEKLKSYEFQIFDESFTTLEQLDNMNYYCGKHLHFENGIYVENMYISSAFMLNHNKEDFFCIASYDEDFESDFIVRI